MKTFLGFVFAVFFALPAAMGAQLIISALALFGYLNSTIGQDPVLVSTAGLLGQLYAGNAPPYITQQQQDFVEAWKAFIDALIPQLKTSFGVTVPVTYIGPFLAAADAKLLAYYPPAK